MSARKKTILFRFLRGLGAIVASALAAFLVGPEGLELVPDALDEYVVLFGAPALLALEKKLRDGGDPNN